MVVIPVPKPPENAMKPNRPVNTLLRNQLQHLPASDGGLASGAWSRTQRPCGRDGDGAQAASAGAGYCGCRGNGFEEVQEGEQDEE